MIIIYNKLCKFILKRDYNNNSVMGYCFSIETKYDNEPKKTDNIPDSLKHPSCRTPLVSSRVYDIIDPNILLMYRINKISSNFRGSSGTDNSVHSVNRFYCKSFS